VFSYALHWNVPGCPHSVPATLSLHFPALPNFSSWLPFILGAIFVFGRRPVRLFLEILLSAWSYKECQGSVWCCVWFIAFAKPCKRFISTFAKLRKATISFVISARLSVRLSAWNSSAPTERIFVKFDISVFFENLSRKFKISLKSDKHSGTVHGDIHIWSNIAHLFLEWETFQTKVMENIKTHILCSKSFFLFPESRAVYEIMWK